MLTTLISRLEHFTALTDQDKGWLNGLVTRFDEFPAGRDIRRQAEVSDGIFVVTAGHACSYKILPDGGRQILEFIFRGDHAELPLEATDDGILALNHTAIAWINHHRFLSELADHPRVATALERHARQKLAILRERITSLGRRDAFARMAHLLCELFERLSVVGETVGHDYRLPVTQSELADTLGLSEVHCNRILRRLESERLIIYERRHLRIRDLDALKEAAAFNPTYLDLNGSPATVHNAVPVPRRRYGLWCVLPLDPDTISTLVNFLPLTNIC